MIEKITASRRRNRVFWGVASNFMCEIQSDQLYKIKTFHQHLEWDLNPKRQGSTWESAVRPVTLDRYREVITTLAAHSSRKLLSCREAGCGKNCSRSLLSKLGWVWGTSLRVEWRYLWKGGCSRGEISSTLSSVTHERQPGLGGCGGKAGKKGTRPCQSPRNSPEETSVTLV